MKLLYQVPCSNGVLTHFLPVGQYGCIMLRYTGTAGAGVTLTRAQLGSVILDWNGQQVINVDAECLNLLNNVYGGVSEFTSAIGGAFAISIFIPCGQWVDNSNVYDIGNSDKVMLKLDFPLLAVVATVATGQVAVYGKQKIGAMNYLHNIISRPVVAGGAGQIADTYPVKNISQIYLKNPAAVIDTVQIQKDGSTIFDAPVAVLNAYSDYIHLLEATNTMFALEFSESKDIREAVGGEVSYKYNFTGAGTLAQYFSFNTFTPGKAQESRIRASQMLGNNISALNQGK